MADIICETDGETTDNAMEITTPARIRMRVVGDRRLRISSPTLGLEVDIDDIFRLLAIEEVMPTDDYDEMLSRNA